MMGYGWGMGVGGWIAMVIFWVALLVLIVWLVRGAFSPGASGRSIERPLQESPDHVLDRRFAAGDIDEESYHRMLDTLRSARTSRTAEH